MGEDKQKVIIFLLVINIILVCFFGMTIKKQLNENNALINSKSTYIDSRILSLENSIVHDIQNILNAKDNMIDDASYSYNNINTDNNKAILDFVINLKAVSANAKIYLAYNEINNGQMKEVELTQINGLSYGSSIELDLNKNYQYDIIERVIEGGESLLNIEKQKAFLYDEFYQRRVEMYSNGIERNNKQMNTDFSFSVNNFGIEKYDIGNVLLEIWYGEEIVDSIDVTDNIISGDTHELLEQYNEAIASGQIEEHANIEEFKKIIDYQMSDDGDREYYLFEHSIVFDTDYPELELDMDNSESLNLNLVITFKDNYTFETNSY